MATPPFTTADLVKDTDLSIKITQSNWTDPGDIDDRITDADAIIQSCLSQLGYPTTFVGLPNTPELIKMMSKMQARAMIWRDLFHRSPSTNASETYDQLFKQVQDIIDKLKDGKLDLLDPITGNKIEPLPAADQAVHSNTLKVPRALTMADPEKQHIHDDLYSDRTVLGNQQTLTDDDANI